MIVALLLAANFDVPAWVQHDASLLRREIVKVEMRGGGRAGEWLRTIRDDGLVTTWTIDRPAEVVPPFKLSRTQFKTLKDLIVRTDFDKLNRGPLAKIDPEAVDAPDDLFVVRKGHKVFWWSNAVFEVTDDGSELFRFLQELTVPKDKAGVLINVDKVSTWG